MNRSCAWSKLDQQLSDESYRKELVDLLFTDGAADFIFENSGPVEHSYSEADLSTVPIEDSRRLSQPYSYYQGQNSNEVNLSKTFLKKDYSFSGLKEAVFENILKTNTESFSSTRTVNFMDFVMDKATHLQNFTRPVDTSLAKFVVAKHDAYVPRDGVADVRDIWPGCEVGYIDTGHVAGSLTHQETFRKAITQMLNKL